MGEIKMTISESVKLPEGSIAAIKTRGLIGEQYIAISPGGDDENIKPGGRIKDTQSAVDIMGLVAKYAIGDVAEDDDDDDDDDDNDDGEVAGGSGCGGRQCTNRDCIAKSVPDSAPANAKICASLAKSAPDMAFKPSDYHGMPEECKPYVDPKCR